MISHMFCVSFILILTHLFVFINFQLRYRQLESRIRIKKNWQWLQETYLILTYLRRWSVLMLAYLIRSKESRKIVVNMGLFTTSIWNIFNETYIARWLNSVGKLHLIGPRLTTLNRWGQHAFMRNIFRRAIRVI